MWYWRPNVNGDWMGRWDVCQAGVRYSGQERDYYMYVCMCMRRAVNTRAVSGGLGLGGGDMFDKCLICFVDQIEM